MKFLRSPYQRLLIADEVGVGKTIEAGIIYVELKSRRDISDVWIICPHALLNKLKDEMESRFDERFEVLDSDKLRYIFREYERYEEFPIPYNRSICSLQLLRLEPYLKQLRELEFHFDLIVVDEAHHMRNSDTNSYDVGELLSIHADAMLFLTATPLHLGNRDFYSLMHLLVPEEFQNFEYFETVIRPNEYLNAAYQIIEGGGFNLKQEALKALQPIEWMSSAWRLRQHPDYRFIKKQLSQKKELTRTERIALQSKLVELNTLAHVYTRTKRKEIGDFVIREPYFISVRFTDEEMGFYNAVTNYAMRRALEKNLTYPWINFALIMPQRQVASCIKATIRNFEEILEKNKMSAVTLDNSDVLDEDTFTELEEAPISDQEAEEIRGLLEIGKTIGKQDSK